MSINQPSQPTILVTDAGRGSAVAIIRSLGRMGCRVIAADSTARSAGFASRYVHERLVYPSPEAAPRQFASTLLEAARTRRIDLVIPITDAAILPLVEWRNWFDGICRLALPETAALQVAINKRETLELARRLGVPAPRTAIALAEGSGTIRREDLEKGEMLGWPVVLKPQASRVLCAKSAIEALGVCYAADREQLEDKLQRFAGRCPVLLQEYYPGTGYGVELLMHEGQTLAAFQHERLREVPLSGGVSALRQSTSLDPSLFDYAERLLREINWTGLAMVEFKVGKEGAKLMEINGRVWGSLPLAVHCGMDFPRRLVELYLNGPPDPMATADTSYAVGVRARNLELDLVWIASVLFRLERHPFLPMPGRDRALAALLGLCNPACKFDILSLEDPRPGGVEIRRILGSLGHKFRSAAGRRSEARGRARRLAGRAGELSS